MCQKRLAAKGKRNATIGALIVATDQTTLSIMCGGQKAYPVYASLANVDKRWRRKPTKRAMTLLGYLPVESFDDIENDDQRRKLKAELVHRSMEKMFAPLREVSEDGVEMWCPDGRLRRVFPRIAAYTADWPEQNLHACTSEGSCPICNTAYGDRGSLDNSAELHDREETLDALRSYFRHNDIQELQPLHLKPVWPWWGDIPNTNLSSCFAPDELHQLHQGIFKTHLLRWLRKLVGKKKIDDRFAAMTRAAGLRHFAKGVSGVSQWTGRESKLMAAQILPVVAGELTPELTAMIRSLVDFIFRAHASTISEVDLQAMEKDLESFHELKDLLVVEGVYDVNHRFNKIAKLHMLSHYVHMIRELGPPDGYNTEVPEHLHIEYAKVPWQASNKVRPLPQMVTYVQRQEAVRIHHAYLDEYLESDPDAIDDLDLGYEEEDHGVETSEVVGLRDEGVGQLVEEILSNDESDNEPDNEGGCFDVITYPNPRRHMSKRPTRSNVSLQEVIDDYGAYDVMNGITKFLTTRLGIHSYDAPMSHHNHVHVWHKLYLHHQALDFAPFDPLRHEVVRAKPPGRQVAGRPREPGVWDVVLYHEKPTRGCKSLIFPSVLFTYRLSIDNDRGKSRANEKEHGILRELCSFHNASSTLTFNNWT
jgi:hypothetical protein